VSSSRAGREPVTAEPGRSRDAEVARGEPGATLQAGPGLRLVAAVVLSALVGMIGGGGAAWVIYQHLGPAQRVITQLVTPGKGGQPAATTVGQLAAAAAASVVTVATQPVGASGGGAAFADGVVVGSGGLILTSAHAVEGASQLRIGLADGRGFDAVIAGSDPAHGLVALRAVGATGLTALSPAPDLPQVGDTAIAVFRPPSGGLSVGVGSVSAVGEAITVDATTGQMVSDAITVDASTEPGADGAPVLNTSGQLIGLVSLVTAAPAPPGITALSLAAARQLISAVGAGAAQPQGTFGVVASYLDPAHAAALGLPSGALIESVTAGGPAALAGLQAGDIVTQVNGTAIDATHSFDPESLGLTPGERVALNVVRAGATLGLTLTVAAVT
jgi:S1-C subfamily serine protease